MKYSILDERIEMPGDFFCNASMAMESTGTSPNKLSFSEPGRGVYLYQANCLELMDAIYAKHPEGCFDMIFADPPYFLSNGGITCQNGRMVKVDKGKWDKSQGFELNHAFNIEWLRNYLGFWNNACHLFNWLCNAAIRFQVTK